MHKFYGFSNSGDGTLVCTDRDELEELKAKVSTRDKLSSISSTHTGFYGCFDPFWAINTKQVFIVSYPVFPTWYRKVVDEFNNTFKNIKVEVEYETNIYGKSKTYMDTMYITLDFDSKNPEYTFKRVLLSINVSDDYGKSPKKVVQYLVHHFFRMLSISESHYLNIYDEDPGEDYIKFVLNLNNRKLTMEGLSEYDKRYRGISEIFIPLKSFLNLDSLKITEVAFTHDILNNYTRQTQFMSRLDLETPPEKIIRSK